MANVIESTFVLFDDVITKYRLIPGKSIDVGQVEHACLNLNLARESNRNGSIGRVILSLNLPAVDKAHVCVVRLSQ